jgi:hypothetical protein
VPGCSRCPGSGHANFHSAKCWRQNGFVFGFVGLSSVLSSLTCLTSQPKMSAKWRTRHHSSAEPFWLRVQNLVQGSFGMATFPAESHESRVYDDSCKAMWKTTTGLGRIAGWCMP